MSWVEVEIIKLKELWKAGKTASEIAAELPGKTRNAVIGKAHRLGLEKRPSPITRAIKIKKKKNEAYQGNGQSFKGRARYHRIKKVELKNADKIKINNTAYGPKKSLMELENDECRWPVDDKFCAAKVDQGSYCEKHNDIAYVNRKDLK